MTLANPVLLFGLLALAVPVALHFLLRPRPRRVAFPALRLLRGALQSGQRSDRLRQVWLLLARCAILACAALMLADPRCATSTDVGAELRATILVLDDSLSTEYRLEHQRTIQAECRQIGVALCTSLAGAKDAVRIGLVSTGSNALIVPPSDDAARVLSALRDARPAAPHTSGLAEALAQAVALLEPIGPGPARLIILTDGNRDAWHDVRPELLAGRRDVAVQVIAVRPSVPGNLAIVGVRPPPAPRAGQPLELHVQIQRAGSSGECWLNVRTAERTLARVGPLVLDESTKAVSIRVPPLSVGRHGLAVTLEPEDRATFDQARFVAIDVTPRPVVWLVPGAGGTHDATFILIRNLLAPETLPADEQRVALEVRRANQLAIDDSAAPAAIVVCAGATLAPVNRTALEAYVYRGATLLLIAGGADADPGWPGAQALLSSDPPQSTPDADRTLVWDDPASEAAARFSDLAGVAVRRVLDWPGLASEVRVRARRSDSRPLIVERAVGHGCVVALLTSPDPRWSDLGLRAATFAPWLHAQVEPARAGARGVAEFEAGSTARVLLDGTPERGVVGVRELTGAESVAWVRLEQCLPDPGWPAARAGLFNVGGSGPGHAVYAVNWRAGESDLSAISPAELAERLGPQARLSEFRSAADFAAAEGREAGRPNISPRGALGLALVALLAAELLLAGRGAGPRNK